MRKNDPVRVVVYDGAAAYRRDVNKMARKGYQVQSTTSRTKKWSPLAGVWTNRQLITVTYVKQPAV